jgi:PKD repeat protein
MLGLRYWFWWAGADVTAPVADFVATPLAGTTPLSVTFTDLSSNATAWLWERNSGSGYATFSTTQNPTAIFTEGSWSIRETATNAFGSDSETKTNYIIVSPYHGRARGIEAGVSSRGVSAARPSRGVEGSA